MAANIRVVFLNARGVRQKTLEIADWLPRAGIDLAIFAETNLSPEHCFRVDGYRSLRLDKLPGGPVQGRGLLALFKECLTVELFNSHQTTNFDLITLRLKVQHHLEWLYVSGLYRSPSNQDMDTTRIADCCGFPLSLLMGDFNCHHKLWGSRCKNNQAGCVLAELLEQDHGAPVLLNTPSEPTFYFHEDANSWEVLDLALTSPLLCHYVTEFSVAPEGTDLDSDHLPLFVDLNMDPLSDPGQLPPLFQFKQTDWEGFQMRLEQLLEFDPAVNKPLESPDDLDRAVQAFIAAVQQTTAATVPKKGKTKLSLPASILAKITARRAARRLYQHTGIIVHRVEATRLSNSIREDIKEFKANRWTKFCESISSEDIDPATFWHKVAIITGRRPKTWQRDIVDMQGNTAKDPAAKASAFASFLEQKMVPEPSTDPEHSAAVHNFYHHLVNHQSQSLDAAGSGLQEISGGNLVDALDSLPNSLSCGPDGINNLILKKGLTVRVQSLVLHLFNVSVCLGYVPSAWKAARVIMLPKPNKPKDQVSSYRPISLTSCLGKLLERVISKHLVSFCEENMLFGKHQCAYRRSHSTLDPLVRLTQDAAVALRIHKILLSVFLDVEGAFDKVPHPDLLYRLHSLKIPPLIINWVLSMLQNRDVYVNVDGADSLPFSPVAGVPQGGVLSPILFLLYVSSIPDPSAHKASLSQYADDVAAWSVDNKVHLAADRLQAYIHRLEAWMGTWGIKVNPGKSQLLLIASKRVPTQLPVIKLHGTRLEYSKKVKFLGVIFDARLTFAAHMSKVIMETQRRVLTLYKIRCLTQLAPRTIINLYKAYVLPVFTYAAPILLSVAKTSMCRLDTVQRRAVRIAFSLPRDSHNTSVNRLAEDNNLCVVQDRFHKLALQWLANSHPDHGFRDPPKILPNRFHKRLIPPLHKLCHNF